MEQNKQSKINFETRPIPSGPGAQQITVVGQECMKGGSEMVSKMPEKYMIKDGASGKKSSKP